MPDRIEIEIIGTGDKVVKGDEETKREEARERRERRAAAERRAEAREQRAQESAERSRRREKQRELDRESREQRRKQREQVQFEKELERERDKREQEEIRAEKDESVRLQRAQVLRRRFIVDMLGTFNRVHLGRRINHAIDFIQAVINQRPLQFSFAGAAGGSFSPGSAEGRTPGPQGPTMAGRAMNLASIIAGIGKTIKDAFAVMIDKLGSTLKTLFSFITGAARTTGDFFRNPFRRGTSASGRHEFKGFEMPPDPNAEGFRVVQPLRLPGPRGGGFASTAAGTATGSAAFHGGRALIRRGAGAAAAGTPRIAGPVVQGTVTASRVGGVVAAGAGGTGGGLIAGAGGGALAAGATNPIVLGVILALVALTAHVTAAYFAFRRMDKAAQKFAETIEGVPSELIFAQVENDLKMFSKQMQRASEHGRVLADIERERGQGRLIREDLRDSFTTPFLPLVREVLGLFNRVGADVAGIFRLISDLMKPIFDSLATLVKLLNAGMDRADKANEWIINNIVEPILGGDIAKAARKYLTSDPLDGANLDSLDQLFQFMGNPLFRGPAKERKLEMNFRDI